MDEVYTDYKNMSFGETSLLSELLPIRYSYDWLGEVAPYSSPAPLNPNNIMSKTGFELERNDLKMEALAGSHSFPLYPEKLGLPWPTGIRHVRQNKHWRTALDASSRLLTAFVMDATAQRTPSIESFTIADMAAKELESVEDGSARCVPYMYSLADEKRIPLIAEMHVLALLCHESWKIHDQNHNREFFKSLVPPVNTKKLSPKSPLQQTIWNSIEAIQQEDRLCGNGGKEMIESLTEYITHRQPPRAFQNLGDLLEYRHKDVAIPLCWASVKFSVGSTVACHGVNLRRIVRLVGDHLLLSNDIASYEKDKMAYYDGMANNFLNTNGVVLIRHLLSLDSDQAAKSFVYALQMETEKLIDAEVRDLAALGTLMQEEWEYLGVLLLVPAGNVLAAVTMRQYGGEEAKIRTDG